MNNSAIFSDIIYCHGLPGSSHEICFLSTTERNQLQVLGPQQVAGLNSSLLGETSRDLHVIGFSLGAMAAIKIAENNKNCVNKLTLISPAAPLELGDFLPEMAGRLVFQSAIRSVIEFRILTALQRLGSLLFKESFSKAIFKGSPESDVSLL